MSDGEVRFDQREHVAHLTFDRPEARNAMTWRMYDQLVEHCQRLDDGDARVAVLRGAGGRAFVAGTDIRQFLAFGSADDGVDYERRIDAVIDRLERVRIPTIAVVEGWAVGGGLSIVAACDWRVAAPDARFGLPIARTVGNCLSMAGYARLVGLIGPTRTIQLLLGAEPFTADESLAAGLLTEVVDPERLDDHVAELTQRIAAHAPLTMYASKEAVRRLRQDQLPDGEDLLRLCYGSQDFQDGVRAFAEKRSVEWGGR